MREIEKEAERMQNEGEARLQKQEVSRCMYVDVICMPFTISYIISKFAVGLIAIANQLSVFGIVRGCPNTEYFVGRRVCEPSFLAS